MDLSAAQTKLEETQNAALAADLANRQAQQALIQAQQDLADAQAQLTAQVAAGTARTVSIIDNAALTERQAGKEAAITFIQAHPTCSQAEAAGAWTPAALGARPADRQWLLHDPNGLLQEYQANLVAAGLIPAPAWAAMASWISATPLTAIMAE